METATDIATFSASVVTEGGKDVALIQKQNIEKMNTINAFLKEQGVEKKDLQTSQYSLTPRYSYSNCVSGETCPPPTITGYTLTQSLSIKVRNFDALGNILSGITLKGANTLSGVSFAVDDDTDAKQVARTEAIAQAKKKAMEVAKAGGFRLGKLVSLYENAGTNQVRNFNYGDSMAVTNMKEVATPVIEPGTQSGELHINLTYEIIN